MPWQGTDTMSATARVCPNGQRLRKVTVKMAGAQTTPPSYIRMLPSHIQLFLFEEDSF